MCPWGMCASLGCATCKEQMLQNPTGLSSDVPKSLINPLLSHVKIFLNKLVQELNEVMFAPFWMQEALTTGVIWSRVKTVVLCHSLTPSTWAMRSKYPEGCCNVSDLTVSLPVFCSPLQTDQALGKLSHPAESLVHPSPWCPNSAQQAGQTSIANDALLILCWREHRRCASALVDGLSAVTT